MRILFLFIFLLLAFSKVQGQTFSDKNKTLQMVFNKLVGVYGNTKIAPGCELLPNNKKVRVIAKYFPPPVQTIKIDEQLFNICMQLKRDSLNALATIISHELAHYYNDHSFSLNYAYAHSKKNAFNDFTLKEIEAHADNDGIWHAAIAGYNPFSGFEKLIDAIYKAYKISDTSPGYPSRAERKSDNKERLKKVGNWLTLFEAGNILTQAGKYEEASICFDNLLVPFASPENYNNAGVAYLLAALQLKPVQTQGVDFIYPVEPDPVSRLENLATRGNNEDIESKIQILLQEAKTKFEKAISIDATYHIAYLNLACVLDFSGNHEGAIGRLNELPDSIQKLNKVMMVKGIAFFNTSGNQSKAALYFNKIPWGIDSILDYNHQLYQLYQLSDQYKIDSLRNNLVMKSKQYNAMMADSLNSYFKIFKLQKRDCQSVKGISICVSKTRSAIEIKTQNYTIQGLRNYSLPAMTPKTGDTKYMWMLNSSQNTKWLVRKL